MTVVLIGGSPDRTLATYSTLISQPSNRPMMTQATAIAPVVEEVYYSVLGAEPDLGEIVQLFVEEMPSRVREFRAHFASSNWDQLSRLAHQLKGAAGSYGFDQITPFAARLEKSICNGEPRSAVEAAIEQLVDACGRVRGGTPA